MTVYVCRDRDIECGHMERSWCATCPKRKLGHEDSNSPELRGIKSATVAPLPAAPAPTDAETVQLRAQNMLLFGLYDAAKKLIKAKGRFHTEQNYGALVDAFDLVASGAAPTELAGELPPLPEGEEAGMFRGGRVVYTDEQMRQQRLEGRRDMHETNITLLGDICKLSEEVTKLRAALAARQAPKEPKAAPDGFLMPEDAWNEYATRSGLLNERGVAPDPAKAQTAYFAYTAAWNRLHEAFSAYIAERRHLISSPAARQVSAPDAGSDGRDGERIDFLEAFHHLPASGQPSKAYGDVGLGLFERTIDGWMVDKDLDPDQPVIETLRGAIDYAAEIAKEAQ